MTAKRSAADADSAQNLRLVAHADLAQLDSGLKHACKVFYQLAEIHPSVRRKIEQNLIVVKGIFRIDQLHFQTVLADLFLTDLKRFFFFCLICRLPAASSSLCRPRAAPALSGCTTLSSSTSLGSQPTDRTIFYPSGSLYNDMVTSFYPESSADQNSRSCPLSEILRQLPLPSNLSTSMFRYSPESSKTKAPSSVRS